MFSSVLTRVGESTGSFGMREMLIRGRWLRCDRVTHRRVGFQRTCDDTFSQAQVANGCGAQPGRISPGSPGDLVPEAEPVAPSK
jgi:hypothetical protein